jgi:hypothetical protein
MKKKFLLQLTILAALKVTPAKAQNIIFVTHARPPTATAFVATAPRVALIFVARIFNIVSCNKIFFIHGLPLTLL